MDILIERVERLVTTDKKRVALTRFEKVTLLMVSIILLVLMAASIYTRSVVSETNARVETVKMQMDKIAVDSQVLQQKIDNLMTYDRIVDVAKKYGLTQNTANIKAVKK